MNQAHRPQQAPFPQRGGTQRGGYIRETQRRVEREEEENDIREPRPNGEIVEVPLTKTGKPDRRFLGARHLPPQEDVNPDFRRARTGGEIDGTHVTIDGKPDRRFKENRALDDDEAMRRWAAVLSNRYLQH
jgi:hypothetical protein